VRDEPEILRHQRTERDEDIERKERKRSQKMPISIGGKSWKFYKTRER
jgi:hypothetical protein